MGKNYLAEFVTNDRTNYVLVMLDWQYRQLMATMSWYPRESRGIDHDRAALQDRFRIFIFGDREWLRENPAYRRFCVGDRKDFNDLAGTWKYRWEQAGDFHDPIRNLRDPWKASRPIAEVSRTDFHSAFGKDAWTDRFPRVR